MANQNGQGIAEYLVFTLVVMVVLVAMTFLWKGGPDGKGMGQQLAEKTYKTAPYAATSSWGLRPFAGEEILMH